MSGQEIPESFRQEDPQKFEFYFDSTVEGYEDPESIHRTVYAAAQKNDTNYEAYDTLDVASSNRQALFDKLAGDIRGTKGYDVGQRIFGPLRQMFARRRPVLVVTYSREEIDMYPHRNHELRSIPITVTDYLDEVYPNTGSNSIPSLDEFAERYEDPELTQRRNRSVTGGDPERSSTENSGTRTGTVASMREFDNTRIPGQGAIRALNPQIDSISTYDCVEKGDRIGSGGNADVYEAFVDAEDRIALKEPRFDGTMHSDRVDRFLAEAETWQKLDDNEYIVDVVDYGADPLPWIALEYMDGGSLSEYATPETADISQRLWIGICICRAVRHAHRRGIAHLDLKPANVLFRETENGTWPVPKVADWGLAKMLLDHSKSVEGFSPEYAAPEQFDSSEYGPADDITDIYQTGAVCYELLTGKPPFTGPHAGVMRSVLQEEPKPPSAISDEVPEGLDKIVLRALEKRKSDRYESIIGLRDDLCNYLENSTPA